jgi:tetratricopeptide (TPR) repeat protein
MSYRFVSKISLMMALLLSFSFDGGDRVLAQETGSDSPAETVRERAGIRVEPVQTQRVESNRRVALVIGNGAYKVGSTLRNPVNDATDIATTLRELGFDRVILKTDADLRTMDTALSEFFEELKKGSVGLFYYAGHGMQSEGENYLVPVDAEVEIEQDLRFKTLPLGQVLGRMEAAGNDMNIVILDACRNNPFARSWRSTQQGLAGINAPQGLVIAYATAPGSVAADGGGRNGTFTEALLRRIKTPGENILTLFNQVSNDVARTTSDRQLPYVTFAGVGEFAFNPTQSTPTQSTPNVPVQTPNPSPAAVQPQSTDPVTSTIASSSSVPTQPLQSDSTSVVNATIPSPSPTPASHSVSPPEIPSPQALLAFNQGVAAYEANNYPAALTALTTAIELNPRNARAYHQRGLVYFKSQQYQKALADYDRAVALDANFAEAYWSRGQFYYNQGNVEAALQNLDEAIILKPDFLEAYLDRANIYYNQKDYDLALQNCSRAIQLSPHDANIYVYRGIVYQDQGNFQAAEQDFDRALDLNPRIVIPDSQPSSVVLPLTIPTIIPSTPAPKPLVNSGDVALRQGVEAYEAGNYQQAVTALTEAIRLNDRNPEAYQKRGLAYFNLKEYQSALEDYNRAITLNPNFSEAYVGRGFIYIVTGDHGPALQDYNRAIGLNPNFAEAYAGRAYLYQVQNQCSAAQRDYERALEIDPHLSIALLRLESLQELIRNGQCGS